MADIESLDHSFETEDNFLSLDEFDQPSPLRKTYCKQLTTEEYEEQGSNETANALKNLLEHLEKDQTSYKKVLKRRKQEDVENSGMVSFLKARFWKSMQGHKYSGDAITDAEYNAKLEELKAGMMKAHNYSQESKGTRFSRRLASKRAKENDENQFGKRMPPPPPPCPPPPFPMTPLKDCNRMLPTPKSMSEQKPRRKLKRTGSSSSLASLASIHMELISSDPLKRLKATSTKKSPGGTPLKRKPLRRYQEQAASNEQLNSSEPLTVAFLRIMEQKFRHVRSPSPSSRSMNKSAFSPSTTFNDSGFTP